MGAGAGAGACAGAVACSDVGVGAGVAVAIPLVVAVVSAGAGACVCDGAGTGTGVGAGEPGRGRAHGCGLIRAHALCIVHACAPKHHVCRATFCPCARRLAPARRPGGVHSVEICCVRCSDAQNGDSLIFALDAVRRVRCVAGGTTAVVDRSVVRRRSVDRSVGRPAMVGFWSSAGGGRQSMSWASSPIRCGQIRTEQPTSGRLRRPAFPVAARCRFSPPLTCAREGC